MGSGSAISTGGLGGPATGGRDDRRIRPPVAAHLTPLLDGAAAVERDLSAAHGPFDLFGLFRRDGKLLWDVVVAAPWLPGGLLASIAAVGDPLRAAVGARSIVHVSRIVVLSADAPILADLRAAYATAGPRDRFGPGEYGGVDLADGFLFRSAAAAAAA